MSESTSEKRFGSRHRRQTTGLANLNVENVVAVAVVVVVAVGVVETTFSWLDRVGAVAAVVVWQPFGCPPPADLLAVQS